MGDFVSLELIDDDYLYFTYDIDCLGEMLSVSEEGISKFLKDVFINLSDIYSIDLFGYYKVDIYVDKKIGAYVEISKLDDFISYNKKIDTKVSLSINSFYLKTNDLSNIFKYRPIYYFNNNYYVSTNDVDNILEIIELCEIVYKDENDFINNIVIE